MTATRCMMGAMAAPPPARCVILRRGAAMPPLRPARPAPPHPFPRKYHRRAMHARRPAFRAAAPRRALAVAVAAGPPTVADAKAAFSAAFPRPLPGLYSTVIQELLVQQHLFRWNASYQYTEVAALGLVSVFDQILEGLPEAERAQVFDAFVASLQEDPARYRADAARLEEWAKGAGGPEAVAPDAGGADGQQALQRAADAVASGKFLYTKFFAVGLFRLLELAGGKDPKALAGLVTSLGVPAERVNADLLTYKGVLSKMQAAKDMMVEFVAREKKKSAERAAEKAAKAEKAAADAAVQA